MSRASKLEKIDRVGEVVQTAVDVALIGYCVLWVGVNVAALWSRRPKLYLPLRLQFRDHKLDSDLYENVHVTRFVESVVRDKNFSPSSYLYRAILSCGHTIEVESKEYHGASIGPTTNCKKCESIATWTLKEKAPWQN